MPFEKRNVVEEKRTPEHEFQRHDDNWDKQAADAFEAPSVVPVGEHPRVIGPFGNLKGIKRARFTTNGK